MKRGDTLSKIANEYKPADVTLDQMLVALFKGNANAFDGNNMNRLRTGAIMTIPSAADVAGDAAGRGDARSSACRRPTGARTAIASPPPRRPPKAAAPARAAARQDRHRGRGKDAGAPAGPRSARVSREAGQGKGGAGAAEEAVARDKAAAGSAGAHRRAREDARRPAEDEHAEERHGARAGASRGREGRPRQGRDRPSATPPSRPRRRHAPSATPPPATTPSTPPAAAPATPPAAATTTTTETPKAEPPRPGRLRADADDRNSEAPSARRRTAEAAAAQGRAEGAGEGAARILRGSRRATRRRGRSAPARSRCSPASPALVAARRRKTTKFEDSIISGTDIKTNTVFGSTGGGVVNTGDNSLASDFSREGLGNIDTDEVDPIAEAEVYLAYGRDAQAEEILKDALKKDPQRQEIYLKLLEIHAQHNKPSAFETVAAELYAVSPGPGRDVAEGRRRSAASSIPTTRCSAMAAEPPPRQLPQRPSLRRRAKRSRSSSSRRWSVPAAKPFERCRAARPRSSTPMAGSTSSSTRRSRFRRPRAPPRCARSRRSTSSPARRARSRNRTRRSRRRRQRQPGFDVAPRRRSSEKIDHAQAAMGDTDLDFHLDDAEKPAPMHAAAEARGGADGSGTRARAAPPHRSRVPQRRSSSTSSTCRSIRTRPTFEDPTPSVLDGQWHDAATKLDLAKAYQEMGDVEGAREILQEVLHEGDDQQKIRSAGAARQARLTRRHDHWTGGGADPPPVVFSTSTHCSMRIALGLEYDGTRLLRLAVAGRRLRRAGRARARARADRRRADPHDRARDAPMPACTRRRRSCISTATVERPGTAWVRGVNAHAAGRRRRAVGAAGRATNSTRASPRRRATTRTCCSIAPSGPRSLAGRVGWYHRPLDVDAMRGGAAHARRHARFLVVPRRRNARRSRR